MMTRTDSLSYIVLGRTRSAGCGPNGERGFPMLTKWVFTDPGNTDLNMYRCGIEDCAPDHAWGPGVRDHFLLHVVLGGSGVFRCGGSSTRLGRCDAFLIAPGEVVDYKADHDDPWSYAWVGFHGLKAEALLRDAGVSVRHPVFRTEDDGRLEALVRGMLSSADWKRGRDPMLLGLLYQFLAVLSTRPGIVREDPQGRRQEEYLQRALDYVAMNYAGPLTVTDLARHAGLDRTYLYSLFMKHVGVSPKDHLLRFRVDRACTLLRTSLSVAEVARSVGYDDPQVFSRVFRRLKGQPPGRWRRGEPDSVQDA